MPIHLHGVFLKIFETGVLITGQSGIGKSKLALTLIQNGHSLIADDIIEFQPEEASKALQGFCPPLLQDFLATRSLGILNIRRLYGDAAICKHHPLHLIIHLTLAEANLTDYLQAQPCYEAIGNTVVPKIMIPITPGFNLATLIEVATRNYQLQQMGYNANLEFSLRQQDLLT